MKNTIKVIGIMTMVAIIVFSIAACNKGAKDGSSSSSSSSIASAIGTAASSVLPMSETDRFLDDYEKFLDDYVIVLNKVGPLIQRLMTGDMTAVEEMEKLQPMIDEFEEKHGTFSNKYEEYTPAAFTPAQQRRMEQIAKKYSDAINSSFGQ